MNTEKDKSGNFAAQNQNKGIRVGFEFAEL